MKRPTLEERRAIVDELGQLEKDITPLQTKEKRAKELRAVIRTWFPKLLPTATVTETGVKFCATVGAMENATEIISMQAVYKTLGAQKFVDACSFTLKTLKELLPGSYESLTLTERTGSRPVKTFERIPRTEKT